jgi:hypothetical protein
VLRAGGLGVLAAGVGLLAGGKAEAQSKRDRNRHPRLAKAIDELRDAREYLNNAPNRFGGHKEAAIEAIDRAIEQLKVAITF